jgi:hypothetical protein
MAVWRFFDYVTNDERDLLEDWYQAQGPEVQAEFDVTIALLAATENWEDDEFLGFKKLQNKHLGLGEMRFHIVVTPPSSRRRYKRRFRPVGIWPCQTAGEFIFILGCEKSGRNYIPHAAFDLALGYKTEFEHGRGVARERL